MKLNVFERLLLLNVLPMATGSIDQLREADKLGMELNFTPGEREALEFEQEGNSVKWKDEADISVEIGVNVLAKHVIVRVLTRLNEEEKLERAHVGLYQRFVEEEEPAA